MSDDNPPRATGSPGADEEAPHRAPELGAAAMKAFAHPLRMALYQQLSDYGPATATMLARATGESTGQTSYHLRQLERHGFVSEDRARGTARERWWKAEGFSFRGRELAVQPETAEPTRMLLQQQVEQRAAALREWLQRAEHEPPEWVDATLDTTTSAWMTPEELAALGEDLLRVIHDHAERARHEHERGDRPRARRVRVYADTLVLPPRPAHRE